MSAVASLIGAAAFGNAPPHIIAGVNAVAAGALLTMVVNTMIPEAVKGEQNLTGSARGPRSLSGVFAIEFQRRLSSRGTSFGG